MVFRTRGGLMSAVTRVENYVADITDAEKEDVGYRMTLNTHLNLVKSMKAKYAVVQDEIIESQAIEINRTTEIANKEAFFTRCDELITKLNVLIQKAPASDEGDISDPFNTSASNDVTRFMMSFMRRSEERHQQQMELLLSSMSESPRDQVRPVTKLPHINLPTFDGKYASWMSFKDRFTASVIKVNNISNSTRLEHLLSSVQGDALSLIKNISITDNNFPVAWKMLEDKFERKNDIVAEHIRNFYAMPRATAANSQEIHQITNTFAECTMALDAMQVTQRDPWLIQYCLDRLDSESRILWGRECSKEIPTLAQFTKFLNQRCVDCKNASQLQTGTSSSGDNSSRSSLTKPVVSQKKHANALVASTSSSACRCCEESSHPLFKCPKFLSQSAGERFDTVRSLSLCRNCFASHLTNSCTFRKCIQCQGRHNQLLHEYYASSSGHPDSTPSASGESGSSKKNVTSVGAQTDSSVLVAVCASECEQTELPPRVFLPTASVYILSSTGENIPCRLVLDGGAQVNLMTSDLCNRLNLQRLPTDLSISGVSDATCRARHFVNASILPRNSNRLLNFKCYILPKVSGNIPSWSVDASQFHIPHDVNLADPQWDKHRPVDLLLSGNLYWTSWLSDTRKLGPGLPVLKQTVYGYVVVGEHEPAPASESSKPQLHKFPGKFGVRLPVKVNLQNSGLFGMQQLINMEHNPSYGFMGIVFNVLHPGMVIESSVIMRQCICFRVVSLYATNMRALFHLLRRAMNVPLLAKATLTTASPVEHYITSTGSVAKVEELLSQLLQTLKSVRVILLGLVSSEMVAVKVVLQNSVEVGENFMTNLQQLAYQSIVCWTSGSTSASGQRIHATTQFLVTNQRVTTSSSPELVVGPLKLKSETISQVVSARHLQESALEWQYFADLLQLEYHKPTGLKQTGCGTQEDESIVIRIQRIVEYAFSSTWGIRSMNPCITTELSRASAELLSLYLDEVSSKESPRSVICAPNNLRIDRSTRGRMLEKIRLSDRSMGTHRSK